MSYTKYVMREDGVFGIISKMTGVEHSVLASILGSPAKVKTAGFLYLNPEGDLQAYGKSISLGLASVEQDGEVISRAIKAGEVTLLENEMAGFFYATNQSFSNGAKPATLDDLQRHRVIERD